MEINIILAAGFAAYCSQKISAVNPYWLAKWGFSCFMQSLHEDVAIRFIQLFSTEKHSHVATTGQFNAVVQFPAATSNRRK